MRCFHDWWKVSHFWFKTSKFREVRIRPHSMYKQIQKLPLLSLRLNFCGLSWKGKELKNRDVIYFISDCDNSFPSVSVMFWNPFHYVVKIISLLHNWSLELKYNLYIFGEYLYILANRVNFVHKSHILQLSILLNYLQLEWASVNNSLLNSNETVAYRLNI